jgi:homoserine dehydrogenase
MTDQQRPPLRLGIAGLGTVGGGVVAIVQQHGALLAARAGRRIEIVAVSARNRNRERGADLSSYAWEDDPVALSRRDDVDVLIEVMGGEDGPAKAAVETAIAGGKHVVTANKAMMAMHGQAMAEAAEAAGVALRYEAGVAGGIPIIKALGEGLAANVITRVMGVMNGTCNYILTEMQKTGADYADVLEDAQRLGYAESDPTFDVGGIDAAHKLALLASLAFGTQIDFQGVVIEGIDRITLADIQHAADMGFRIKLLGVAQMTDQGLVPAHTPLGQLDGVTNAVVVEGDHVGQIFLQGPGAGAGPTASAIMADVIDIARGLIGPAMGLPAVQLADAPRAGDVSAAAFYLRLSLKDKPGVLAKVAAALGEEGVSIHQMRQYDHDGEAAPLLIVTHSATRSSIDGAMGRIGAMEDSLATPIALRIENV